MLTHYRWNSKGTTKQLNHTGTDLYWSVHRSRARSPRREDTPHDSTPVAGDQSKLRGWQSVSGVESETETTHTQRGTLGGEGLRDGNPLSPGWESWNKGETKLPPTRTETRHQHSDLTPLRSLVWPVPARPSVQEPSRQTQCPGLYGSTLVTRRTSVQDHTGNGGGRGWRRLYLVYSGPQKETKTRWHQTNATTILK